MTKRLWKTRAARTAGKINNARRTVGYKNDGVSVSTVRNEKNKREIQRRKDSGDSIYLNRKSQENLK
jgi:hypothetical protein